MKFCCSHQSSPDCTFSRLVSILVEKVVQGLCVSPPPVPLLSKLGRLDCVVPPPSFPILNPLHNPRSNLTPSSTPLTNCSRTNLFDPPHEMCPTITYHIKQEELINEAMSGRDSLFSPTKYFADNYNNSSLSELSSVLFMLCATLQCMHMRMHVYMRYIQPSSRHGML